MEYYIQYQSLAKDFHEKSYKNLNYYSSENNPEKNKYINMGEELKEGLDQLIFMKKETGNDYQRLKDFISTKSMK